MRQSFSLLAWNQTTARTRENGPASCPPMSLIHAALSPPAEADATSQIMIGLRREYCEYTGPKTSANDCHLLHERVVPQL